MSAREKAVLDLSVHASPMVAHDKGDRNTEKYQPYAILDSPDAITDQSQQDYED